MRFSRGVIPREKWGALIVWRVIIQRNLKNLLIILLSYDYFLKVEDLSDEAHFSKSKKGLMCFSAMSRFGLELRAKYFIVFQL